MRFFKKSVLLILFIFVFVIRCGMFEPENRMGSMIINVTEDRGTDTLNKITVLSSVQCIVNKGSSKIYDEIITKQNGRFDVEITDLEPADNYSVLLYGKNSSSEVISRAYHSGITVKAGSETQVNMSWAGFQPLLFSPSNDTTITDNTPCFDWSDVSGASNYELQVDSKNNFSSPDIDKDNLTLSNYTVTNSLSDSTWYWRVRVKDSEGNWGNWSETWSFTIDTHGPSAPTLNLPANSSTITDNTPYFAWSSISGVSCYELEVDNISSFSNPEIHEISLTDSSYTASTLLVDGTYYWRVRAKDSNGTWGNWSSIWSFTINTQGPSAPTLNLPVNGSTISDNTPYFDWSDVSGASNYELQVDNMSNFSSPNIDQKNLTSSSYTAVSSLSDSTWYWRVRAKDSNGTWGNWSSTWNFTIRSIETGTMTDQDGNVYKTVKIGSQWWMAENLKVTHYRNGDAIPNVTGDSDWAVLTTGAYCAYNNNESNAEIYGYLYNWHAVDDSRSIAPEGWHVPTDEEWKELEKYLGMSQTDADDSGWRGTYEGSKLKETSGWYAGGNGNNESGFSALAGGCRYRDDGHFSNINNSAYFWASNEFSNTYAWYRGLDYKYSGIYRNSLYKQFGLAVRLVKGEASIPVLTSITISPFEATLKNGETQQFICTATYSDQSTKNVTASTFWSLSPGTTGNIDSNGIFTANATSAGTDTVIAVYQGRTAKAYVTITTSNVDTSTMIDQDGNVYKTVKIGDQWWMAENLKVTHYRNGDAIPNVTDNTEWADLSTGAYCAYDNDENNADIYGYLYNWYAVDDSRNIAPTGWHVPTDDEWADLVTYLGGNSVAGGKLKEADTAHWNSPNTGATNESGFSALPGGYRNYFLSRFYGMSSSANFWSTIEASHSYAKTIHLYYDESSVSLTDSCKYHGYSVRLIKDN